MNDQILMRVTDRGAYPPKKLDPLTYFQPVFVAKAGHRNAVHKLEHKVRRTVSGRPAIDQSSNIGVLETRQYAALEPKPPKNGVAVHAAFDQLDGKFLFKTVADGAKDSAHTARPDDLDQLVITDLCTDQSVGV